jgi:hypothetical protein
MITYCSEKAFARVLEVCENPPKPSAALIELVRKGRAMRKAEYVR